MERSTGVETTGSKLLLVEDNEMSRDMLTRWLQRRGYEVVVAADGNEALLQAGAETPALILMDMDMPEIDGWEATRQLRNNEALRRIPVIALTAHGMPGDREKALGAGCDEYESKPFDFASLQQKIENFVHAGRPSGS